MKKTTYLILLITAGMIIFNACTKRIDIDLDESYVRLAVEGYIMPDEGVNYVRLTKSSDYFANEPAPAVTGATVEVSDDQHTYLLSEAVSQPGTYLFPADFQGEEQKTYTLNIRTQEKIGDHNTFTATDSMPEMTLHIDSITLAYNTAFDFWMILMYAPKPPGRNFYLVKRMNNDTLVTAGIADYNIFDDELLNNDYMHGIAVMGIDPEDIRHGDKITLVASLISEEYYNFILEAQTELQPHDPMFSGPPANVSTNVNNGAIGYFAAYPSTSATTYFEEDK